MVRKVEYVSGVSVDANGPAPLIVRWIQGEEPSLHTLADQSALSACIGARASVTARGSLPVLLQAWIEPRHIWSTASRAVRRSISSTIGTPYTIVGTGGGEMKDGEQDELFDFSEAFTRHGVKQTALTK